MQCYAREYMFFLIDITNYSNYIEVQLRAQELSFITLGISFIIQYLIEERDE